MIESISNTHLRVFLNPSHCTRKNFLAGMAAAATNVFALPDRDAGTLTSISVVGIAALLTALGLFDKIAQFAGAGTLVPITGFANAVASPAIDSRSEGLVLGIGTKIFSVAGPVLLYGTLAGAVYGIVYYIAGML